MQAYLCQNCSHVWKSDKGIMNQECPSCNAQAFIPIRILSELDAFVEENKEDVLNVIEVYDGKYAVVVSKNYTIMHVFRYKDRWRDVTGDNLVRLMAVRILELEEEVEKLMLEF